MSTSCEFGSESKYSSVSLEISFLSLHQTADLYLNTLWGGSCFEFGWGLLVNNIFKKLKKTPTQENEITYKTFKNKLTHIIRIAKKNYFKEKFDMHRNNGEKTWETISQILKNKNKKLQLRIHLLHLMVYPALTIQTLQITSTHILQLSGTHWQQTYHKQTTIQLN